MWHQAGQNRQRRRRHDDFQPMDTLAYGGAFETRAIQRGYALAGSAPECRHQPLPVDGCEAYSGKVQHINDPGYDTDDSEVT
jgi:hypothetical protein